MLTIPTIAGTLVAGTAAALASALTFSLLAEFAQPLTASAPADPSPRQQRRICFPDDWSRRVKAFQDEDISIWTDADGLDGQALLAHLQAVGKYLAQIASAARHNHASSGSATAAAPASAAGRPVAIAICQDQKDYQALWRRVGEHYGGQFGDIATQGFSYRVFCATSFGEREQFLGRLPVVCHEFTHVWLFQRLGLANDANWLTEGVASAVQLHFFPQAGDRRAFAQRVRQGRYVPLKRLLEQERTAPQQYWQAATLVEMVLKDRPAALPELIGAKVQGKGAGAIVQDVLKVSFSDLEKRWAEFLTAAATSQPASAPAPPRFD